MTEAQVIACGSCGKRMKIPPTHFGKKIKCPGCANVLQIAPDGSGATVAAPAQAAPPQVAPPRVAAPPAAGQRPPTGKVPPQPGRQPTGKVPPQSGRPAQAAPGSARAAAPAAPSGKAKPAAKPKKAEKPSKKERLGKGKLVKPKGNLAGKGELKGVAKEVHKDEHVDAKYAKAGAELKKRSVKGRLEAQEKGEGGFNKLVMVFVALIVLVGGAVFVANQMGLIGPQGPDQGIPESIPILPGKAELGSADIRQVPNPFSAPGSSSTVQVSYFKRDTDDMEFVLVKGGSYKVGTNDRTLDNLATPEIEVTVGDFYISRYEVTIAQFRKFTNWLTQFQRKRAEIEKMINNQGELLERRGQLDVLDALKADRDLYDPTMFDHPLQPSNKSHDQSDALLNLDVGNDTPMYQVDWWDAYAYCNWANAMNYARGTLPTDIEWEIAARAVGPDKSSQGGIYPWSGAAEVESIPDEVKIRHYGKFNAEGTAMQFPKPVGGSQKDQQTNEDIYTRCANAWGIYDMWGNVGEWTYDWWDPDLYRNAAGTTDYYNTLDKARSMAGEGFDPVWADRSFRTYGFRTFDRGLGTDLNSFAVRGGRQPRIDEKDFDKFLGFRCVYYKDRDAPYTAELKKLYDAKAAATPARTESNESTGESNERHAPTTALPYAPVALRRRDGSEELEAAGL